MIVFCWNITVNYIKDIKLLDSQSKICVFLIKQGSLKFWGDGLLNNLGPSDEGCGEYCVSKDGSRREDVGIFCELKQ